MASAHLARQNIQELLAGRNVVSKEILDRVLVCERISLRGYPIKIGKAMCNDVRNKFLNWNKQYFE